jgi:hypothetical protein
LVKFAQPRPYADLEAAMQKVLEIASTVEPVQDGRIHIEKINGPFLFEHSGKRAEYTTGMKLAIARGLLWMHESQTYLKFTQAAPRCSLDRSQATRPPSHRRPRLRERQEGVLRRGKPIQAGRDRVASTARAQRAPVAAREDNKALRCQTDVRRDELHDRLKIPHGVALERRR